MSASSNSIAHDSITGKIIFGMVSGALIVGATHFLNGGGLGDLLQLASLAFVTLSTLWATFLSCGRVDLISALRASRQVTESDELVRLRKELVSVGSMARKEGFLALETAKESASLPILKEGIQYLISGFEAAVIRDLLRTRIDRTLEEGRQRISVWETAASVAPSMGALGATLGLLTALTKLDDPSQLGRGIAAAMASVLYGFFLSNFVFMPIATRARRNLEASLLPEEMVVSAVLAIQEGVNPQVMDEKLALMGNSG